MLAPLDMLVVCPILISRTAQLDALDRLLAQSAGGVGTTVLIAGEAGIGKSRLVAEAMQHAAQQGFGILHGRCFETDRGSPYAPFVNMLRAYIAARPADPRTRILSATEGDVLASFPELSTLISGVTPPSADDHEQLKRRLFYALTQFFTRLPAPLLIVIEDLHWSDDTSLNFLHSFIHHIAQQAICLLMTYRDDEVPASLHSFLAALERERMAHEFLLSRLARDDVELMIRTIFVQQHAVRLDFLEAIVTLSEGNPFFIEEILKSLVAAGDIYYDGRGWNRKPLQDLRIPRTVQDAVQRRTQQLSEPARQLLTTAAVAGRRFDFTLLQAVTNHDEQVLLTLIKSLIKAQLVVEESPDQFAFRHALTRQAIYAELLGRERKALHQALAVAIERHYTRSLDVHLAELSYHTYEAEMWSQVMEYARRAGEQAQALYAPSAALEHYSRALEASRQLDAVPAAALHHAQGQMYGWLGEFEQARLAYMQALTTAARTQDARMEWQSLLDLGFLWTAHDYRQASDYLQRALQRARTLGDPATLAATLNRLGNWRVNAEQPEASLSYHQEALAVFEQLSDQRGLAETWDLLGTASYYSGDLVQGTTYYRQAVALGRSLDLRQVLVSSLTLLAASGPNYLHETLVWPPPNRAEEERAGNEALRIAHDMGWQAGEAFVMAYLAFAGGARGDYAHAFGYAQASLDAAKYAEHRHWLAAAQLALGLLHLDCLAMHAARVHLDEAQALTSAVGSLLAHHFVIGGCARLHLAQGQLAQAESVLAGVLTADTPIRTPPQRMLWMVRAELELARGQPAIALAVLDRLCDTAGIPEHGCIAQLWLLRGEALIALDRTTEAEEVLREARACAHMYGARPLLWRVLATIGRLYQAQGRTAEAEEAVGTARTLIEELAIAIPNADVRERFQSDATATLPRRRSRTPNQAAKHAFGGLTAREREVAIWLTQGKANREIAEAMIVSERTVEDYISNILGKLNLSSRTQIAIWASQIGLIKRPG